MQAGNRHADTSSVASLDSSQRRALVICFLALMVVGVVVPSMGCLRAPTARTDVSKRSPGLILLPNALDVQYYDTLDEKGDPWSEQLSYHLAAEFPAADVVCSLTEQIQRAGWRPLREDDSKPGTPSSFVSGWRVLLTHDRAGKPVLVDQWIADWVNNSGGFLLLALTYRHPVNQPTNRGLLQVGAIREPAGLATTTAREAARRRVAPIVPAGEPARVSSESTCKQGG